MVLQVDLVLALDGHAKLLELVPEDPAVAQRGAGVLDDVTDQGVELLLVIGRAHAEAPQVAVKYARRVA
eukprot:7280068-Alexandrium_andersonii.AAC.1